MTGVQTCALPILSENDDHHEPTQLEELNESEDLDESVEIAAPEVVVEPGRKRRRSVSTGVISGE